MPWRRVLRFVRALLRSLQLRRAENVVRYVWKGICQVSIAENIAASKAVGEFLDFIGEQSPRFWWVLAEAAAAKCDRIVIERQAATAEQMTESEIRAFERLQVPFGKHAGERVMDVPPGYWLAITEGNFNPQLSRYLRTKHFQNLQGDAS